MVDNRTDLLNLRTSCKLKLPHHTEEGADQTDTATTERQKKKTLTISQPPGETMTDLLLKYQYQDWMLEE
jgi:hypothetical protein